MLADARRRRGTVRAMAQRSLLLPAMAVAAVLGAIVMAVVVVGGSDHATPAAASAPATVTLPGTADTATGGQGGAGGSSGGDAQGAGDGSGQAGSGDGNDQGAFGDEGDQGQDQQGDGSFVTVPSLAGMRLDDATSALANAGLDRQIDGGGLFGVVDDTAWTVCATTPDAGTEVVPGDVVVVHVDRSCI
jgi:hypothetical protein